MINVALNVIKCLDLNLHNAAFTSISNIAFGEYFVAEKKNAPAINKN